MNVLNSIKPRQVAGFFVYRHLGLVECNISIHSVAILSFGETYSSLS